ncbi:hypothetical protein ASF84_27310 [Pseudomonas sp. Leaf127]|nr:hypothetical protein ASF84_27310 [Pseudomonas sp. Leaf127]
MRVQVLGNLLQAFAAGIQPDHVGAGGHAGDQAVTVLDPCVDEHHGLARLGRAGGDDVGGGMRTVLAGIAVGGGVRCGLGHGRCRVLGRGVGHGRGHRAVEQHARLQAQDHGRNGNGLS